MSLSNASIATRRTGLEEVLKYKKANYTPAVETARRENAEALKKARDEWLGSEKLRLDKLAERKTGELKKDAVSALEPELHRLISGNKLDLEQRRELRDDEFEAFCAQQEREGELKMQVRKQRITRYKPLFSHNGAVWAGRLKRSFSATSERMARLKRSRPLLHRILGASVHTAAPLCSHMYMTHMYVTHFVHTCAHVLIGRVPED